MTALASGIEALRAAVAGRDGDALRIAGAIDPAVFADQELVAVPGAGTIDYVTVRPIGATTVEQLERDLGPARWLPRSPSGGARTVLFSRTMPADGESGATVLAEIDPSGRVGRLIVRADSF